MTTCRTCGEDFNPKFKRKSLGGYIDECNDCAHTSGDAQTKYVGRPGLTNKDASVEIFRSNLQTVRAQLRRESAIGFGPNLGIGHPVAVQAVEDSKESKKDFKHLKETKDAKAKT